MIKKSKRLLAVALTLALTILSLAGCGKQDNSDKLVIGGTGPLTGEASTYGISVKRGAQIAIDEINKDSGINGIKLDFIFEDDEADGTKVKSAFEKLMDNGMQIFMGTVTSGAGVALNNTVKTEGILQVTPSASQLEAIANENSFRICFNDSDQGKAMAEYIYQNLGYTKAAILYNQDDSYSTGLYNAFKERWTELGGTVSADTSFAKAATDFNAQLTKIVGSDAQFLFMPIYAEKAAQIAIAANNKSMKLPIIGCDGLDGILNYLEGDNAKLVEGLIYYTPFIASDTSDAVQSFVAKYKEKYNIEPDQFAADAYDAIYVIKATIEKAGLKVEDANLSAKELGKKLVPAMTKIEVDGLTGKMTFSASGEPTKSAKVAIIKDGKYAAKD